MKSAASAASSIIRMSSYTASVTGAKRRTNPGASAAAAWASSPISNNARRTAARIAGGTWRAATDDQDVSSIQYAIANSSSTASHYSPLAAANFTLAKGHWSLSYHATDVYGNVEADQLAKVLVDTTAPQTTLTLQGLSTANGVFLSPANVSLAGIDPPLADGSAGSGIQSTAYSLDGGQTWQPYLAPFLITTPYTTSLLYRSVDIAGNIEVEHEKTITIMCSVPGLQSLLDYEYAQGRITTQGGYQTLLEKLVNAQKDLDKGQPDKAIKKLQDFSSQIDKETGKGTIAPEASALLKSWADCILTELAKGWGV